MAKEASGSGSAVPALPDLNIHQKDIAKLLIQESVDCVFGYFKESVEEQGKALTYACLAIDSNISQDAFDAVLKKVTESAKDKDEKDKYCHADFNKNLSRLYGWAHGADEAFNLLKLDQCGDLSYLEHFVPQATLDSWKDNDHPLRDWNFSFTQDSEIPGLDAAKRALLDHWKSELATITCEYVVSELNKLPLEVKISARSQAEAVTAAAALEKEREEEPLVAGNSRLSSPHIIRRSVSFTEVEQQRAHRRLSEGQERGGSSSGSRII